jgi:hypothetical protein
MALAVCGVAEHYYLQQIQIIPHLAYILIGAGGAFVFVGFLLFGSLIRRDRRRIEEAVQMFQRSGPAAKHWVID